MSLQWGVGGRGLWGWVLGFLLLTRPSFGSPFEISDSVGCGGGEIPEKGWPCGRDNICRKRGDPLLLKVCCLALPIYPMSLLVMPVRVNLRLEDPKGFSMRW